MNTIRKEIIRDWLRERCKGEVCIFIEDDTIYADIHRYNFRFRCEIPEMSKAIANGLTAADLAEHILSEYFEHILSLFFKKGGKKNEKTTSDKEDPTDRR